MPNMSGFELTRLIREMEHKKKIPSSAKLYITGLTANVRSSVEQDCLEVGMNDILVKPVSSKDVIEHVRRVLHPSMGDAAEVMTPSATISANELEDQISANLDVSSSSSSLDDRSSR